MRMSIAKLKTWFVGAAAAASFTAGAAELSQAPEAFSYRNGKAVPIDIKSVDLALEVDVAANKTVGHATVEFEAGEAGYPFFDLVPRVTQLILNGTELNPADLATVDDPDRVTKFRVLNHTVEANSVNKLEIVYDLTSAVPVTNGVARAGFFMSDLTVGGRSFWEQYGPANYEFDQFSQKLTVRLNGATKAHKVYTNGTLTQLDNNTWSIQFPDYFTTSSFYFHMVEQNRFKERRGVYKGLEREIPVISYAESEALAQRGLDGTLKVLAELEGTYGPYAHHIALAYITPDGGGMEYCGATMTSLWALEHEFTHSFFARGVMPANGNAGFIDEAIASWRDDGYIRASRGPSGAPHNLGGFSQYRRHTTMDAYSKGRDLIGEFDKQFENYTASGLTGMRAILRQLFTDRQRTTITVQFFKDFLEGVTGVDLTDAFEKYVYGRTTLDGGFTIVAPETEIFGQKKNLSKHPRPYTAAELARYR